jgi:hypothetical protein
MLANSEHQFQQASSPVDLTKYGVEEGKTQSPAKEAIVATSPSRPGFGANFFAKIEEPSRSSAEERGDALTSVWNTDIKRSNSSDPMVPPQALLSSSYDEIDMSANKHSPPSAQPTDNEKSNSGIVARSVKQEGRPAEYSGRASYDIPVDDDDDDEKTDDRRLDDKKKPSFFSRAFAGLIGSDSSSNVVEKSKTEAAPEVATEGDIETGVSPKDKFLRANSETENAPKAVIRRGSTNAEKERELTRKSSIRTSQTLAHEAAVKVAQRRASQDTPGAVAVKGDDVEKQLGGDGADEEKSVGSGKGGSSVTSAQSSGRKSNRSNQKMNQML